MQCISVGNFLPLTISDILKIYFLNGFILFLLRRANSKINSKSEYRGILNFLLSWREDFGDNVKLLICFICDEIAFKFSWKQSSKNLFVFHCRDIKIINSIIGFDVWPKKELYSKDCLFCPLPKCQYHSKTGHCLQLNIVEYACELFLYSRIFSRRKLFS